MANDYDFNASSYPLNAWPMPGADSYGWPEAAGIPIDDRELRWAATGIMADLHHLNFREHTAGETFKALDPLVSHAPQGFTLADVAAARRTLSEIAGGQDPDATAARFAGD